jgi:hypothetical protein
VLKSPLSSKAVKRPSASADMRARSSDGWRLVVEAMLSVRV